MLSFFNLLMNVAILWTNEVIQIPVGESLDAYKYLPEALLYVDDKLVSDRLMYYEYEVNYTTFNVIRTHVVGTYTVWYRVHFPTLGFESDVAVIFNVYDHIKPTISGQKDMYVDVGTKSIDYKPLISYSDNYTADKDLILTIYAQQVNLNQIGTYQVTYSVKDKAFNESTWIQNIHVVDRVKPTIKQKSQVSIQVGSKIDLDKFFTFSDNYDSALEIILDDQQVNYQYPSTYPALLYVRDQSGNNTTLNFNVTINDTAVPKIILKTNTIKINFKDKITTSDLRSYILAVEDNLDTLNIDDVEILNYIDTSYLGKYEVIYRIKDSSNLVGETKLLIEVMDLEAPTIELLEKIQVDVNTLEPYIFDYLVIQDNYNGVDDLIISKTGMITMSKVGSYRVIVKVVDQAKNATEFPVIIEVVDRISPKLEIVGEYVITNFDRPDYMSIITTQDNYDKDILVTIDDQHIDYSQIGSHQITITANDSSNNQTTKTLTIHIKDLSHPEIILKTHQIYIAYGTKDIDYLSYIEDIFDTYDQDLKTTDIEITTTLDTQKIGLYQVIYALADASGNVGHAVLYIHLNDYEKPTIESHNIKIKVGEFFNYFNYVQASDNYDGDLSHMVKMNPSFIPLHQPGYYEVIFYVHDASGNYAETKVLLTIEATNHVIDYIYYIIGGVIIIGGIIIYFMYMKKRDKL